MSPSAQPAVLGHALMISAARIRSAMPLANSHPQESGNTSRLAASCALTVALYLVAVWLLPKLGINL
jgi:hypothetical protein